MNSLRTFNGLGTTSVIPTGLGRKTGRLNGWFGKLLKSAISKVAHMAADYVNGMTAGAFSGWLVLLTNAADGIGSGGSSFWNKSNTDFFDAPGYDDELPMTAIEENTLMDWVDNQFQPFYNSLLLRITQLSTAKNLATANLIIEQITVIKALYAFHKGKQDGIFSGNATSNRSTIVSYLLDEQLKIIAEILAGSYQKPAKITVSNHKKLEGALSFNLSVLPSQIDGYQFTTEKTDTPVNTTSVVTTVTPTGVVNTDKSSNTKKIVGVGLIGLAAFLLLTGTKKTKK